MVHLYLLLVLIKDENYKDKKLNDHKYDLLKHIFERKNAKGKWFTPIEIGNYINEPDDKCCHIKKNLDEVLKGTLKLVPRIGKNDELNNLLMLCLQ
jgi:hypothetical protein